MCIRDGLPPCWKYVSVDAYFVRPTGVCSIYRIPLVKNPLPF